MEELIEEYCELTRNCYEVDYGDKSAMKKNNESVVRMYEIVETVKREFGAEGISQFARLLAKQDSKTNLWIATQLLEKAVLDKQTEQLALSIIEKAASGDNISALGYKYWINAWKSKHGK